MWRRHCLMCFCWRWQRGPWRWKVPTTDCATFFTPTGRSYSKQRSLKLFKKSAFNLKKKRIVNGNWCNLGVILVFFLMRMLDRVTFEMLNDNVGSLLILVVIWTRCRCGSTPWPRRSCQWASLTDLSSLSPVIISFKVPLCAMPFAFQLSIPVNIMF